MERQMKLVKKQTRFPLVVGSLMTMVGIVAIAVIYQKTREIVISLDEGEVLPLTFSSDARPDYYKGERKHAHVSILEIPVMREGAGGGASSISVEFTLETSNRYLKNYMEKHELWVRDRLLSTLEPVDSGFILTTEGRDIIKWKVLDELNQLTEEKGVEGQIERVSIKSIITT